MLKACVWVDGAAGSQTKLDDLPCSPEKTINIRVEFANPFDQLKGWLAAHFDASRKDRRATALSAARCLMLLSLALALIVVCFYEDFIDHSVETDAHSAQDKPVQVANVPYSSSATHEAFPSSKANLTATSSTDGNHIDPSHTPKAKESPLKRWLRIAVLVAGPGALLVFALYNIFGRRPLCNVGLVILKPHEPFPTFDRDKSRQPSGYVFALRALGSDVRKAFFSDHENTKPGTRSKKKYTNTLQITHAGFQSQYLRPPAGISPQSYWSLIRYAISLRIVLGGKVEAYIFTARLHQSLLATYALILSAAIILPASKIVDGHSHFSLLIAGLGISWAIVASVIHKHKDQHLSEWERLTNDEPFRGCPIYMYSESEGESASDNWTAVDPDDFKKPIRNFGIEYSHVIHFIEGSLLALLLELLHLIH